MANGKGIFKNFYSSFLTLPATVTAPESNDSTHVYGVVTDEFYNFGQRMAARNRNENAKEAYLNNCNWPSSLKHTYCYYWVGTKTDGIKDALVVFYSYSYGKSYIRLKTGELTQVQLERLEAVIKDWHLNGKLIIHNLDFPIEIEVI